MVTRAGLALAALLVVAGCGVRQPVSDPTPAPQPTPSSVSPTPSPTPSPRHTSTPAAALGETPPSWLGQRVLPRRPDGYGVMGPTPPELVDRRFTLPDTVPELPGDGFAARVSTPAPDAVISRSTWVPRCPVGRDGLSWVRLTFWGFDHARHTGELLVAKEAAGDLVKVFRQLYADRFPIEEMRITTKAEQTAPPTGDGNDTGAFNCRATRGTSTFSQHAYGLAVDVDPFQNPYHNGDVVLPELASSYLDRGRHRPGMILPDGPVVRDFASIGWTWGGTWRSLQDLQHFSRNGR